MQVLKPFEHLLDVDGDEGLREAAKLLIEVLERATFDELHHYAELVATLDRLDILHDVFVIEVSHQVDLVDYRLLAVYLQSD